MDNTIGVVQEAEVREKENPSNDGKWSKKKVGCDGIRMKQSKMKWFAFAHSLEMKIQHQQTVNPWIN